MIQDIIGNNKRYDQQILSIFTKPFSLLYKRITIICKTAPGKNSAYDSQKDEVYAFEELIGSHGGAGGTQQRPFIMYPCDWKNNKKIVGAENVYKFFKKEMK